MMTQWQRRFAISLGGLALIAPLIAPNDYWVGVFFRICLYSILALSLNIVVGFSDLLDLGYVAFFGVGSYVYACLASPQFGIHLPFLVAVPCCIAATPIAGILIGAPTPRLRGDYLAIVTLGCGEITYLLLINGDRPISITNGVQGIISTDPPWDMGSWTRRVRRPAKRHRSRPSALRDKTSVLRESSRDSEAVAYSDASSNFVPWKRK